jgi:hypothetical protein
MASKIIKAIAAIIKAIAAPGYLPDLFATTNSRTT